MKIAVIGAGIVGITTAFELARDGHDVTVFEKNNAAAEGATFANSGVISPSTTLPWTIPTWSKPSAFHLLNSLKTISLKKGVSRQDIQWLWAWGKASSAPNDAPCRNAAHALTTYSRSHMQTIANEATLEFQNNDGHLLAVPTEASYQAIRPTLSTLKANAVSFSELPPSEAIKIEPSLGLSEPIHCAIYLPEDGAGNCRQFALLLRAQAQKSGVKFQFGADVTEISVKSTPYIVLRGFPSPISFEAVAVCTGEFTASLKYQLKIKLPMAAVHGYSISAMIREPLNAPRISVMDVDTHVVITRMGNRLRISGGAELGGVHNVNDTATIQSLYRTLHRYFPGAIQYSTGTQIWKGARILTGDGLPLVGASNTPGIWLNLAHGGNGWGNACGASRLLADLISRKKPDIDQQAFSPSRAQG